MEPKSTTLQCRRPLRSLSANQDLPSQRNEQRKRLTSENTGALVSRIPKPTHKTSLVRKFSHRYSKDSSDNSVLLENHIIQEGYMRDHMRYILGEEKKFILKRNFLENTILSLTARCRITSWLMKIQHQFAIPDNEYYMAVKIMDLVVKECSDLQEVHLMAVTSLWILNKFGQNSGNIQISHFEQILPSQFSASNVKAMERKILKFLDFKINVPEPSSFLEFYLRKLKLSNQMDIYHGSYFVCDCLSLFPKFSYMESSLLAAISVYTALFVLDYDPSPVESLLRSDPADFLRASCKDSLMKIKYINKTVDFREPFMKYSVVGRLNISSCFENLDKFT